MPASGNGQMDQEISLFLTAHRTFRMRREKLELACRARRIDQPQLQRGCCWFNNARNTSSIQGNANTADDRNESFGFRLRRAEIPAG